MKKARHSTIDGFIPRHTKSQLGATHDSTPRRHSSRELSSTKGVVGRELHSGADAAKRARVVGSLQSDIDVDMGGGKSKQGFGKRRRPETAKPRSRARRIIKWTSILVVVIGLGIVGYVAFKAFSAGSNVFKGNIFDAFTQNQPLKQDANGRTNILIFGTSGSAGDEGHPGANLTDSIMVLSIDQTKKDAYMISLPRDLYVHHSDCNILGTTAGKLNETYFCSSNDGKDETAGATALQQMAGQVVGLDVQYFVHLNWGALIGAVDAVGGIDMTITSDDPRGVLDRNFDGTCNYKCYFVNYKNGEHVHLDGQHALALARARNANGGYGLPNANFDREKNQQKILQALQDKALSAGTFTNIGAVTGLIDTAGKNLHTNFESKEIKTLMQVGLDLKKDSIKPISLVDGDAPVVMTGDVNGESIVRPVAGPYDYSGIQALVRGQLSNNPVTKEKAAVEVLNGSSMAGVAQVQADRLTKEGLIVKAVANAPRGTYADVEIYQIGTGNPATLAKLEALYGSAVIKTAAPPVAVASDVKFVVVIGRDPKTPTP